MSKQPKIKAKTEEWLSQWERLLRVSRRFSQQLRGLPELSWDRDGAPTNPVPESVADDFYALALNAWHLHDWIDNGSAHAHTIQVPHDLRRKTKTEWMRSYPWLAVAEAVSNSWKHLNVAEDTKQLLDEHRRFVVIAANGHNISMSGQTWPAFNVRTYFAEPILASDFSWPIVHPRPIGRVVVSSMSSDLDYTCVSTDGLTFAEGVVRDWHRWIETCGCAKAAHIPWPKVEEFLAP